MLSDLGTDLKKVFFEISGFRPTVFFSSIYSLLCYVTSATIGTLLLQLSKRLQVQAIKNLLKFIKNLFIYLSICDIM